MGAWENTEQFAKMKDESNPLKSLREEYFIPKHDGVPMLYFTGNSLGLQPKGVKEYLLQELSDWEKFGVEGHFDAKRPWFNYHEVLTDSLARIVGAKKSEVVAMNQLTVNLHLMMISF